MEVNNNQVEKPGENLSPNSQASKIKITITITDTDDMELPENQLHALFNQFENLRKSHTEFEQFLVMVRIDLMTKQMV